MNADEVIQYICESVRTCFPPTFKVEFSEGQGGIRGVTTHVRVVARVATDRLLYDQRELLRLVEGELIDADQQYALIEGTVKGTRYQLRLDAEPQIVQ
jgi:hypothetical protein